MWRRRGKKGFFPFGCYMWVLSGALGGVLFLFFSFVPGF
jgi:hypothetical protein